MSVFLGCDRKKSPAAAKQPTASTNDASDRDRADVAVSDVNKTENEPSGKVTTAVPEPTVETGDARNVEPEPTALSGSVDGAPTNSEMIEQASATEVVENSAAANERPADPEGTEDPVEGAYPAAYNESPNFVVEGPEQAIRVSYDDLDLLKIMGVDPVPLDVEKELPSRIRDLDGRRIRIRGFMFPPFAPDGLTGFVLARDNEICCFGRSPKIYDIIPVELRPTVTTRYIEARPFDVVGVIHVEPDDDGEELFQLFYIDDAIVIE